LIPLAVSLPLVSWLVYLEDIVSISRTYRSGRAYFLNLDHFVGELLNAYVHMIQFDRPLTIWHGSTFFGFFLLPFLFLGFRRSVLAAVAVFWQPARTEARAKPGASLCIWLLITIALTNGLFGLSEFVWIHGDLMGIRNYGFLLTACIFIMAVLAGWGMSEIAACRYSLKDVLADTLLFAILSVGGLWLLEERSEGAFALIASAATFAAIAALWRRLARRSSIAWVAILPVVVIFLELAVTTFGHLPTLSVIAARTDQPGVANLAQTLEPSLGQSAERLPAHREFEFSGPEFWPYQFEGPAVFKIAFSYSDPYHQTPLSSLGLHGITHFFRVGAYEDLLREHNDPEILQAVFGVTRPILELVPRHAVSAGPEGLSLVLRDEPGALLQALPDASGEIKAMDYQGDRLRVDVEVSDAAVLIYRDNMAPGWTVSIDGARAELMVVDRVNKAVALRPGTHAVEFLYRPWAYIVAFCIRATVLIASALACLVLALHGRREAGGSAPGDPSPS
jgi:hypothetical protein